jgi:hypothetical protein
MYIRVLAVAAIGMFGGAGAGALTFGWDASMATGSSFIGSTRSWWPLAAAFGALSGAVFGVALGLCISLARVGTLPSTIAGTVVGAVGVAAILFAGEDAAYWRLRSVPSRAAPLMLSLLIWALLGLLLNAVGKSSDARRE